ncbi:unnamed protein product [Pleuronectes platessa]|uniref:Uncharacterized protein n=1 Tax=Pleuronectes platessa TaxID=8262 RepID=A0A9N7TXG2_PLEPL|nr:unnamed protein product [Pleuronectes platessa]
MEQTPVDLPSSHEVKENSEGKKVTFFPDCRIGKVVGTRTSYKNEAGDNAPPLHRIRECPMPFQIQSVAREALSCDRSITLPLLEDKAMPNLSTHSHQVTLACSTPKPKRFLGGH